MSIKVNGIKPSSLVDGEGIRYTIFFQGCPHRCEGCHSPHTWNLNEFNMDLSPSQIILDIKRYKKYITGITLSGGDPLMQPNDLLEFLRALKADKELRELDIWMWTGYEFEEIPRQILQLIDVVIDGKFNKGLLPAKWRGSNNQKIYRKVKGTTNANHWMEDKNE